ncbi:MAG: T9SS type A sorting domain-containing protein [Bacteroidota bacterium]
MNRRFYKLLLIFLSLTPMSLFAQVDVTLTIANKEVVGNELYFDIFLSTTNANALYLADADFVIEFDPSAFSSPSFLKVENPAAGPIQFGFMTLNREQMTNDILDDVFKFGVYSRMVTSISFTGQEFIINYLAQAPNSLTELEQNVPFVDNQLFVHSLGRFRVTNVIHPVNALDIGFTTSSIIPTDVYTYDPNVSGIPAVQATVTLDNTNALPLELLSFDGWAIDQGINHLEWITASEIGVSHFEIERSKNGLEFAKIGEQIALGNNLPGFEYAFKDEQPNRGLNYYRLKMVDQDGSFEYSDVITIKWEQENEILLFPVPAVDQLTVEYTSRNNDQLNIVIYDESGKRVFVNLVDVQIGVNQIPLPVDRLAGGQYLVTVIAVQTEEVQSAPFLKLNP